MKVPSRGGAAWRGALLTLVLVLGAGCGDGETSPPTTDVDLATLNPPDVDAAAALSFLGVRGGRADGAPVRIGFINQGTGAGAAPEALDGARAAVAAINEELGGVNGRPLELVACNTQVGEPETACAEQLRDTGVVLTITGRTPVDPATMVTTLDTIPLTGVDPRSEAEERHPYAAYYVIGRRGVADVAAQWVIAQTTGRVLLVTDEASGDTNLLNAALRDLQQTGRLVSRLELPVRAAEDGALDRPRVADAIRTHDVTTIILLTGPGGCVATAEATRGSSADLTVVTSGMCSQRSVHDVLGDWTPSWTHVAGGPNLERYDSDPETAYYRHAFETHAGPDADWTGLANSVFSAFMNATRALNQARDLSPAAIVEALRTDHGPGFAAGRPLACGTGSLPARCLNEASLFEYTGGRHWQLAPGGERIEIRVR